MAVDPKHACRDAAGVADSVGEFDDPTEDLSTDVADDTPATEAAPAGADAGVDAFEPGRVLCGRYELERVAGRGGFCVVLGARDLRRQDAGDARARVAIKALRPELRGDGDARRRLTSEFTQLQQLSHPGIVRVYDLDRQGEDWFLVMELLEGVSLAGLMKHCEGERLPARRALSIVKECAGALAWAHGRGIVHGDVKPGNVFVTRDDGVRLLDFGAASAPAGPGRGPEERPAGFATPAYASPQVLQGREPAASDDVYSLACVAFELLTGTHPFDRLDAREAWAREMHPVAAPELDAALRNALEAALSFDRERRPESMTAFIGLLEPAEPAVATPDPMPVAVQPVDRRPPGFKAPWLAAVVVLAAVIAGLFLFRGDPVSRPAAADRQRALMDATPQQVLDAGQDGPGGFDVPDEAAAATPEREAREEGAGPVPASAGETAPASGLVRQRIGFTGGPVLVSRSAPAAAIPLRRTDGSSGRAVVTWRIDEGSARSGRDFAGPLSGAVVLADGQRAGTVFIPLVASQGALEDRSFGVIIDSVRGAASKGDSVRVDVTLRSFVRNESRSLAARD